MAKKKKRKAPRVMKWVTMGCEGVTKDGRVMKGWRPPAAKGQCPRPGIAGAKRRTAKIVRGTKACSPLVRKSIGVGWKRGYSHCEKALPEDLRHRVESRRAAAAKAANIASDDGIQPGHNLDGARRRKRRRR